MSTYARGPLLFESAEWNFDTINRIHEACAEIAHRELGLSTYDNQLEIVNSEQMLDAYTSIGMPILYHHWSFGKHFLTHEEQYKKGISSLAYELVINSSPCISYLMEGNTATMQALVIAHAAFGHNHFFKNNHLFKTWTDAGSILDYLAFAKRYIAACEEKYGVREVERLLDAAHALMPQGVFRGKQKKKHKQSSDLSKEEELAKNRAIEAERMYNDLWGHTVPAKAKKNAGAILEERRRSLLDLPQENILYFLEKHAPKLATWQREVLRIVRNIAQYFYPQVQTKVMNEGCATYVHYRIMNRLLEKGRISEGNFLEFLMSHTSVTLQPDFEMSWESCVMRGPTIAMKVSSASS